MRTAHQQWLISEVQRVARLREHDPEAADRWVLSLTEEDKEFLTGWFQETAAQWQADFAPFLAAITAAFEEFAAVAIPQIAALYQQCVDAGLVEDIDAT